MRRFTAFLLVIVFAICFTVSAFADGEQTYKLDVTRNGKVITGANGERIHGRIEEKIVSEFYRLMKKVPVNFDKFESMVFEVTVDVSGSISFGKQVVTAENGKTFISNNASVLIFENAYSFHFTDDGETTAVLTDYAGNVIETSAVFVTGKSGQNICSRCGNDQGLKFHAMSCGHYSCEVGEVGHGDAACGVAGHYACDGADHEICFNCLKPMCSGKHGVGVCQHVHSWEPAYKMFSGDNSMVVVRSYCSVCHAFFDSEPVPNPDYKKPENPPV